MKPAFCLVEQIDEKVQISGKGDPQQIGDHEIACGLGNFVEQNSRYENENPEGDEPKKREQIALQIEENDGPKKVENKLEPIDSQGRFARFSGCQDEIGSDAHQDV